MSLHTQSHQGSWKPSSWATFTLNSHWGRAASGEEKACVCVRGSLQSHPTLCDPVDCGLPGFSVREWGVLQARTLEGTGQYRLPHPSRALHFLLPQPPAPLRTWCCQSPCNPSSCTTPTPGPPWDRPKSSRADSGANPRARPTCRGGNKTTTDTQGQCG